MTTELINKLDNIHVNDFWNTSDRADLMIEVLSNYRFTTLSKNLHLTAVAKKICLDYLSMNMSATDLSDPEFLQLYNWTNVFVQDEKRGIGLQDQVVELGGGESEHTPRAWARLAAYHAASIYHSGDCPIAVACALVASKQTPANQDEYQNAEYFSHLAKMADLLRQNAELNEWL